MLCRASWFGNKDQSIKDAIWRTMSTPRHASLTASLSVILPMNVFTGFVTENSIEKDNSLSFKEIWSFLIKGFEISLRHLRNYLDIYKISLIERKLSIKNEPKLSIKEFIKSFISNLFHKILWTHFFFNDICKWIKAIYKRIKRYLS